MREIIPETIEEHAKRISLIVSVFIINASLNRVVLAPDIPIHFFFDDNGEYVYVNKKKETHKFKGLNACVIMAADRSMQEGRGNCEKRMRNMSSYDIVDGGKAYHLKANDKKILCVGANSMAEATSIVTKFLRIVEATCENVNFLRSLSRKEKDDCISFLEKNVEFQPSILIKRSYEINEDDEFYEDFKKPEMGKKKSRERKEKACRILIDNYLDEYNCSKKFINRCKYFFGVDEDSSEKGNFSSLSEESPSSPKESRLQENDFYGIYFPQVPLEIVKSEIYSSIFHFQLSEYFPNKYFFRFDAFCYFLDSLKRKNMEKEAALAKDESSAKGKKNLIFNTQYFPVFDTSLYVTVDSQEKTKENELDEKKKILKHRFSVPSTLTIKQISPSSQEEAYEVYLEFIKILNKFIKKELKTTFSAFKNPETGVYEFPEIKELEKRSKGRRKKVVETPSLCFDNIISPMTKKGSFQEIKKKTN